ncbi:hypothetical protein [Paramagnetospirillum magneticum]|nr:hypothetical protein [Paramagnetospirillum magneticum]
MRHARLLRLPLQLEISRLGVKRKKFYREKWLRLWDRLYWTRAYVPLFQRDLPVQAQVMRRFRWAMARRDRMEALGLANTIRGEAAE